MPLTVYKPPFGAHAIFDETSDVIIGVGPV